MNSSKRLTPFRFAPIFKERIWGGNRLQQALSKNTPPTAGPIGESWDLVDLPDDQSRVAEGPMAGVTLQELVQTFHNEILGPAELDGARFPLLVKYLDATQTLSIQVHPGADDAARLGGRPKSEAWYILDATPGAELFLGLRPDTTAEQLQAALTAGKAVEDWVARIPAQPGVLFPVPPGTVHAIGAGILLAEVQQPSDTTYRVYDWGRQGLDGNPRELHVDQALECIDFGATPPGPLREGVVDMGLFHIHLLDLNNGRQLPLKGEGPAVAVGLQGDAAVSGSVGAETSCSAGEVVLVPHGIRSEAQISATSSQGARLLLVTFPIRPAG